MEIVEKVEEEAVLVSTYSGGGMAKKETIGSGSVVCRGPGGRGFINSSPDRKVVIVLQIKFKCGLFCFSILVCQ